MRGANAFHTRSVTKAIDSQYVEVGAGGTGSKIVPGVVRTLRGRKLPSLAGPWGSVTAFRIVLAEEMVAHQGEFIEPFACFPDPRRSMTNSSSVIFTVAFTGTGVSVIPSSSTVSLASKVPWGSSFSFRLVSFSPFVIIRVIASRTSPTVYLLQSSSILRAATLNAAA